MLEADGIDVRVVSMPCNNIFNQQPESYRSAVLPKSVKSRLAIERALQIFGGNMLDQKEMNRNRRIWVAAPANELFDILVSQ